MRYVSIKDLPGYDRSADAYSQLFHFFLDGECDGVVTHTHYARNTFIRDALGGGGALGCDVEPIGPVEGEYVYSIPFRDDADDPLKDAASYAHALLIADYAKAPIEDAFFPVNPRVAAGCGAGPTDDDQDLVFGFRDMIGYFFIGVVGLAVAVVGVLVGKGEARYRAARPEPGAAAGAADAVDDGDAEAPLNAIRRELADIRERLDARAPSPLPSPRGQRKKRGARRAPKALVSRALVLSRLQEDELGDIELPGGRDETAPSLCGGSFLYD